MFKKQIKTHNYTHTAFTLVELLVVMSIISLLMSILVPSLNKAKQSADALHCRANLRNLTLAWSMYTTDNDGKLCSADTFLNDPTATWPFYPGIAIMHPEVVTPNHWVADGAPSTFLNPIGNTKTAIQNGVLWPYTQSIELYKCVGDHSKRLRSYSMSIYIGQNTCWKDLSRCTIYLNQIKKPSGRMLLIDATALPQGRFGQVNWLSNPFYPIQSPDSWLNPSIDYLNSRPTNRHDNGCNISFVDLHCEPLKWQDRRTIKWMDGEIDDDIASEGGNPDAKLMFDLLGRELFYF